MDSPPSSALASAAQELLRGRVGSEESVIVFDVTNDPCPSTASTTPSVTSPQFWEKFCSWLVLNRIKNFLRLFGWLCPHEKAAMNRLRELAAQKFSVDNDVHERLLARYFSAALKILSLEEFNHVIDFNDDKALGRYSPPAVTETTGITPSNSSGAVVDLGDVENNDLANSADKLETNGETDVAVSSVPASATPHKTIVIGPLVNVLETQSSDGSARHNVNLFGFIHQPMLWGGLDGPRLGFQSKNPRTDFRGGGALSLRAMVYFAERHPTFFRRFLESALLDLVEGFNPTRAPSGRVMNRTHTGAVDGYIATAVHSAGASAPVLPPATAVHSAGASASAPVLPPATAVHSAGASAPILPAATAVHSAGACTAAPQQVTKSYSGGLPPRRLSTAGGLPRKLPSNFRRYKGRCQHLENLEKVENSDGWAGSMKGFPFSAGLVVLSNMLMLYFGLLENMAPLACHPDNEAAKGLMRRTASYRVRATFAELLSKNQLAFVDLFSAAAIRFHLEWTARFRRGYLRTGTVEADTSRLYFNSLAAVKREVVSLFEVRHQTITVVEDLYAICRYPHLSELGL